MSSECVFKVRASLCAFRQLIPEHQSTSCAAAERQTALFTSGFGARKKVLQEGTLRVEIGVGTFEGGRAVLKSNQRVGTHPT